MERIKSMYASLAGFLQCVLHKCVTSWYRAGSGCKKQVVKVNLYLPLVKSSFGQNLQPDVVAGDVFPIWIGQKGEG